MTRNVFILGGSGRIGNALQLYASANASNVVIIERKHYSLWKNKDSALKHFEEIGAGVNDLVICASGIIDPKVAIDEITYSNVEVPSNACSAAIELGANAVSLGTVLEKIIPVESQNTYVSSKTKLCDLAADKWLHLQLHTVYGAAAPAPFMFTGLMFGALQNNERFSMTSGKQLREYHHVEDEARAIFEMADSYKVGQFDLSSGDSITLSALAKSVFKHFGRSDLLGLGDMRSPDVEAYEPSFARQSALKTSTFRSADPAVAQWLEKHI